MLMELPGGPDIVWSLVPKTIPRAAFEPQLHNGTISGPSGTASYLEAQGS